jgi:hypothetical protein
MRHLRLEFRSRHAVGKQSRVNRTLKPKPIKGYCRASVFWRAVISIIRHR